MKICVKCGEEKALADFYADRSKSDGRHSVCIACTLTARRAYYRDNREKVRARNRSYWETHKAEFRQNARKIKLEVIAAYGGECACCGETAPEFLTIDHIDGGGKAHRRELAGYGRAIYRWLKAQGFPQDGFQLLCWNCNCAKGFYGTCPHVTGSRFAGVTSEYEVLL